MAERKHSWVTAAEYVLSESPTALTDSEIARKVYDLALMTKRGDSPEYSVQSAIMRHLKANGEKSPFNFFDGGSHRRFGLKKKHTV